MPDEAQWTLEAALSQWRDITMALSPIIGHNGVDSLFRRSLQLQLAEHSALSKVSPAGAQANDFLDDLREGLLKSAPETASAANTAVLLTFIDLLSNLIGTALTQRLIGFAHTQPSGGDTARDS